MSADSLARGYSMFVTYLAEPAVRSLVIGCIAGIALWAFRVKRVGTHLLAWTAVLCASLAMPLLDAFLPRVPVALPQTALMETLQTSFEHGAARSSQHAATKAVAPTNSSTAAHGSETELTRSSKPLSWPRVGRSARATAKPAVAENYSRTRELDATKSNSTAAPAASSGSSFADIPAAFTDATFSPNFSSATGPTWRFAIPWTAVVLGIYLLGVLILFARLLVGVFFSGRLEDAAENISDREALRPLRFRSCIAGLANAPKLKESAMLGVPATVGVHRAVILIPAGWRAWTEEQLDAILAHEISHIARRDALTQMLSLVHRAIFWFSPLSWWLDKKLTDLAEQASDEAALAGGADRARYAETLVGFFSQLRVAQARVWWQGVSMAKATKASGAERRVSRILAWKESMSMKKSFAFAVIALAAPIVFLAASIHPFVAHAQDKPPVPPQTVVHPGGPVAPALPNAPKGGVNGGVVTPPMPPAPRGGVVAPASLGTPPAATLASPDAPKGGVNGGVVAPSNMGTTPIVPPALAGPRMVRPSQTPIAPPAPTVPPHASITSVVPFANETPLIPTAAYAGEATYAASSSSVQDAEAQVRAAKQKLDEMQAACEADSFNLVAAEKRLEQLEQEAASAPDASLRAAKQQLDELKAASDTHKSLLFAANQEMLAAKKAWQDAVAAQQDASNTIVNGSYTSGGGPRYVMMFNCKDNGCNVNMSGSDEDLEHARKLRRNIKEPFIWFERDEKSYVITDAAFIAKVKELFAPEDALGKQEDELGRQEDALGKQEDDLGKQEDNVKVKVPDISPDIDRVRAELDELRKEGGATQNELGRLQSELGRLQSQVGGYQSRAGVQQSVIGRQQSDLGRQQAELGRKQAELGREESEISRNATRQLRGMFDDAITKGIAKPE